MYRPQVRELIANQESPLTLFAIGSIMAFSVVAIACEGLSYDEAWSLFMVQHPGRWIYDAHPPVFYWLSSLLGPTSDIAGRLLNLLYLAFATGAVMVIGRQKPSARLQLTIAAVVMVACPLCLYAIVNFRSYTLMLALWGITVATFLAVALDQLDFQRGDWPVAALGGIGIVGSLNLHYFDTLLVASMLGIFIVSEWLAGQRRWALLHIAAAGAGSAIFLFLVTIHLPTLRAISSQLEWSSSLFGSIKVAASVLALIFCVNLAALYAAIGKPQRFAGVCAVALITAVGVALAANAMHGVLLRRYLMPLVPVGAALIAAQIRSLNSRMYVAMLANAVLASGAYLVLSSERNWDVLAELIGRAVKDCPSTQVIGVQNWRMAGIEPDPLPDQAKVYALGYGFVARHHNFRLRMAGPAASAATCPVIVWAEHYQYPMPTPAQIASRANVHGKFTEIWRSKTGFAAVFR